ncbi:MAG: hypothetical protein HC809_05535 [Gammaproteobacteria bacterium]|nr:hypothetical protein [Gammaproteobacteria bacterium]
MKRGWLFVSACLLFGCTAMQPMGVEPRLPDTAIIDTEALLFHASQLDSTLLIAIALPPISPRTAGSAQLPVIYTLGDQTTFAVVAATAHHLAAHGQIPPAIVVGIHTADLVATDPDIVQFIATDLRRYLEAEYPIDSRHGVLTGYGASASTVLTALFDLPALFSGYLVASPTLASPADHVAAEAHYAASHDDLPVKVFFGVEGLEVDPPPGAAAAVVTAMTNNIRRRGYPNLHNETVIFAGETQASVLPAAISRGLRFIFR